MKTRSSLILARTINVGNFSNVKIEVGEEIDISSNDDAEKTYEQLKIKLMKRLTSLEKEVVKKYKSKD